MKKYLFLLAIIFSVVTSAQTEKFNNTYNGNSLLLSNIIIQENNYYGLGGNINEFGRISIYIAKFDSFGNLITDKTIGDNEFDYYHGTQNSLISNADGGYSLSCHKTNPISQDRVCLFVKFDQNFDTLWTKRYFDNPDFTVFYNHIQTSDGGYALVGCNAESDLDGDVLLVKTDSEGNMQWYKKYGTSARDLGFCIISTDDGGYLIGGSTDGLGHGDGYLIKTDSEGNQQWTKHYGNPLYPDGSINAIIKTDNNEFVFALSTYVTDPISSSFFNRRYSIIKIDSDFNEVWNNIYGVRAEYTGLCSITVANNGDIMATISDDHISGVMRVSAQGDSTSTIYYPTGESIGESALLAIKQTPDNGFIMAGVAYDPQVMWLVKTDSCGCVVEDCECGGSEVEQFTKELEIEVYPNPASKEIWIEYLILKDKPVTKIEIFNIEGQLIITEPIRSGFGVEKVNISALSEGNYIIKLGEFSKKISVIK